MHAASMLNRHENRYVELSWIISRFPMGKQQAGLDALMKIVGEYKQPKFYVGQNNVAYVPVDTLLTFILCYPQNTCFCITRSCIINYLNNFVETVCQFCGFIIRDCICVSSHFSHDSEQAIGSAVEIKSSGIQCEIGEDQLMKKQGYTSMDKIQQIVDDVARSGVSSPPKPSTNEANFRPPPIIWGPQIVEIEEYLKPQPTKPKMRDIGIQTRAVFDFSGRKKRVTKKDREEEAVIEAQKAAASESAAKCVSTDAEKTEDGTEKEATVKEKEEDEKSDKTPSPSSSKTKSMPPPPVPVLTWQLVDSDDDSSEDEQDKKEVEIQTQQKVCKINDSDTVENVTNKNKESQDINAAEIDNKCSQNGEQNVADSSSASHKNEGTEMEVTPPDTNDHANIAKSVAKIDEENDLSAKQIANKSILSKNSSPPFNQSCAESSQQELVNRSDTDSVNQTSDRESDGIVKSNDVHSKQMHSSVEKNIECPEVKQNSMITMDTSEQLVNTVSDNYCESAMKGKSADDSEHNYGDLQKVPTAACSTVLSSPKSTDESESINEKIKSTEEAACTEENIKTTDEVESTQEQNKSTEELESIKEQKKSTDEATCAEDKIKTTDELESMKEKNKSTEESTCAEEKIKSTNESECAEEKMSEVLDSDAKDLSITPEKPSDPQPKPTTSTEPSALNSTATSTNSSIKPYALSKKWTQKFVYVPTGDKIYRCTFTRCGQCFDTRAAAALHDRAHGAFGCEKVAHLACWRCDYSTSFTRWFDLLRHLRVTHEIVITTKPLSCSFCGLCFDTEEQLSTHINFHYLGKYKCVHCGALCWTWKQVQKHRAECAAATTNKEKKLGCPYCSFVFHIRNMRNIHMLSHVDQGLICIFCENNEVSYFLNKNYLIWNL